MAAHSATVNVDALPWKGPWRRYDIIKEGVVAIVIVSILTALLAAIFSSPDDKAITFKEWANAAPEAFAATAVQELAGTSGSATYGPPYNSASDGLNVGPLFLQKWAGVRQAVDPSNSFVIARRHGCTRRMGQGGPGTAIRVGDGVRHGHHRRDC